MRKGYDPYNSHDARRKSGDAVEFSICAETVKVVRKAQLAQVAPTVEPVDWSQAEHVVLENGK